MLPLLNIVRGGEGDKAPDYGAIFRPMDGAASRMLGKT